MSSQKQIGSRRATKVTVTWSINKPWPWVKLTNHGFGKDIDKVYRRGRHTHTYTLSPIDLGYSNRHRVQSSSTLTPWVDPFLDTLFLDTLSVGVCAAVYLGWLGGVQVGPSCRDDLGRDFPSSIRPTWEFLTLNFGHDRLIRTPKEDGVVDTKTPNPDVKNQTDPLSQTLSFRPLPQ